MEKLLERVQEMSNKVKDTNKKEKSITSKTELKDVHKRHEVIEQKPLGMGTYIKTKLASGTIKEKR